MTSSSDCCPLASAMRADDHGHEIGARVLARVIAVDIQQLHDQHVQLGMAYLLCEFGRHRAKPRRVLQSFATLACFVPDPPNSGLFYLTIPLYRAGARAKPRDVARGRGRSLAMWPALCVGWFFSSWRYFHSLRFR